MNRGRGEPGAVPYSSLGTGSMKSRTQWNWVPTRSWNAHSRLRSLLPRSILAPSQVHNGPRLLCGILFSLNIPLFHMCRWTLSPG